MTINCEYIPEFEKVLANVGINAERIRKEQSILIGRTVYEYFLFQKGILKSFTPGELTLKKTDHLPSEKLYQVFQDEYQDRFEEEDEDEDWYYCPDWVQEHAKSDLEMEEFEFCFEKNLNSRSYYFSDVDALDFVVQNSKLNLDRICYFNGRFVYGPEFKDLLETRIVKTVFRYEDIDNRKKYFEFSAENHIYSVLKTYETLPKELYLNPEIELKRILLFTHEDTSFYLPNEPKVYMILLKYRSILQKYFEIKKSGPILKLKPLKSSNEVSYFPIARDESKDFHKIYFHFLYGNAGKIEKLNFQSIYKLAPELLRREILTEKQLSNQPKQLSHKEIRNLQEISYQHDLGYVLSNYSLKDILRIYRILKKLEINFGREVWKFAIENHKLCLSKSILLRKYWMYHNQTSKIHSFYEKLRKSRDISDFQEKFKNNSLEIIELFTPKELQEEGKRMKHCVGAYYQEVLDQTSRIFHLSYKKQSSTLELVRGNLGDWRIEQNKGKCNSEPVEILKELADRFVEYLKG
ncbi:MAG: PcfJ domain-containing protein [Leptospiraceae bacterium]|nr:PcfJ domain-containing protein [Leptospiraceae bacterium]MCP5510826.1 PcfJ domain-containing protein [Leptospiraceae bacterium]